MGQHSVVRGQFWGRDTTREEAGAMGYRVQLTEATTGRVVIDEEFQDYTRAASRLASIRDGGGYDPRVHTLVIVDVRQGQ